VMAEAGGTVAHQTLFYPSTNVASGSYPSYGQYGEGHWLTRRSVETFRRFYLPDPADWTRASASPLLSADEALRKMPDTLIITCGCDPLRDEGEAYASRLRAAGVRVTYRLEEQMIHACLSLFNSALYPAA